MEEILAPVAPPNFSRIKRERKSTIYPQRRQLILSFIHEHIRVKKIPPTYADIAEGIGYSRSSAGMIHTLVEQLINEGWLMKVDSHSSRSLLPVYEADKVYCEITEPELKKIARRQHDLKILK